MNSHDGARSGFPDAARLAPVLRVVLGLAAALVGLAVPVTGHTAPGDTELVSVVNNTTADPYPTCGAGSKPHQCVSGDGRYVVFQTDVSLVPSDTNGTYDIYIRDRTLQETRLVSAVTGSSAAGNGASQHPAISANGRFVAFQSAASNLVYDDTNGSIDVFVRDLVTGTTERVSLTAADTQASGSIVGWLPAITADGRFVVFMSSAALVPGDSGDSSDIYVRDRSAGTTQRVTIRGDGLVPDGGFGWSSISDDGRFVAFQSFATNLIMDDTNSNSGTLPEILVRDMQTGAIERVSARAFVGVISGNGRYVAFSSVIPRVSSDTNKDSDVYVWDRLLKTTQQISVAFDGSQLDRASDEPAISADGRFVAFDSVASNVVKGDTNGVSESFVRDVVNGTTERVNIATSGLEGNDYSWDPSISADGAVVAFTSQANNLVATPAPWGAMYVHELGGPQIKAYALKPSALTFGDQTITTARTLRVAVLNTGTVPIWVASVGVSGPAAGEFHLSKVCHGWLQPTLRCRTSVTFQPMSVGGKSASFDVTAAGVSQSVPLSGTGVLASYTVAPGSLSFGSVSVGSLSPDKTVRVTNTGSSVLPLKYIALVGTEASQFRRANTCLDTVAAGSSCTVSVRFAPTSVGAHQANLAVGAGGGAGKKVVTVSGTGL